MGRATTTRLIEQLDAVSRTRALTDRESRMLQRMITMEGRYDRMRHARSKDQEKK